MDSFVHTTKVKIKLIIKKTSIKKSIFKRQNKFLIAQIKIKKNRLVDLNPNISVITNIVNVLDISSKLQRFSVR